MPTDLTYEDYIALLDESPSIQSEHELYMDLISELCSPDYGYSYAEIIQIANNAVNKQPNFWERQQKQISESAN